MQICASSSALILARLHTFASSIKKVINWGVVYSARKPPAVFGGLTPLKARMVCLRESGPFRVHESLGPVLIIYLNNAPIIGRGSYDSSTTVAAVGSSGRKQR